MITVSVVSHGQGEMASRLVKRLLGFSDVSRIVMTCNIPETLHICDDARVVRINNPSPKGFGANHNAAFRHCATDFFCVLNPDIELPRNPFPLLTSVMQSYPADIAAPVVFAPAGTVEDSVRHFPTVGSLFLKAMGGPDGRYIITPGQPPLEPDWVAGMFILFHAKAYKQLQGFDESYFLYYEDVDIGRRAHRLGLKIVCCPEVSVIHHAQRASRLSIRHMRWHLASMIRYLGKLA
jgi:N-acetylglucosaminyl-diphospho-decaprenol L-rhamnosyltransferase